MAEAGRTGALLALFTYCCLLKLVDTGPNFVDPGPRYSKDTGWNSDSFKHFGYGNFALLSAFLYPNWHNHVKQHARRRTAPRRQHFEASIITICLLMSGDIHQCPGPFPTSKPGEFGSLQCGYVSDNNRSKVVRSMEGRAEELWKVWTLPPPMGA